MRSVVKSFLIFSPALLVVLTLMFTLVYVASPDTNPQSFTASQVLPTSPQLCNPFTSKSVTVPVSADYVTVDVTVRIAYQGDPVLAQGEIYRGRSVNKSLKLMDEIGKDVTVVEGDFVCGAYGVLALAVDNVKLSGFTTKTLDYPDNAHPVCVAALEIHNNASSTPPTTTPPPPSPSLMQWSLLFAVLGAGTVVLAGIVYLIRKNNKRTLFQ